MLRDRRVTKYLQPTMGYRTQRVTYEKDSLLDVVF
jgi:hypothetical protein